MGLGSVCTPCTATWPEISGKYWSWSCVCCCCLPLKYCCLFWPDKVVGGSLDQRNKAVLLAAGGLLPERLHGVPPGHTVHLHVAGGQGGIRVSTPSRGGQVKLVEEASHNLLLKVLHIDVDLLAVSIVQFTEGKGNNSFVHLSCLRAASTGW